MIELRKGCSSDIGVKPRWFEKSVLIDEEALDALKKAQSILTPEIRLVITRAYQPESGVVRLARILGGKLFGVIYQQRKNEITEIFSHNGHATDGTHIDVSIEYNGKILALLPQGVFTTPARLKNVSENYSEIVDVVRNALQQSGFIIHHNKIEALQIHCDFKSYSV